MDTRLICLQHCFRSVLTLIYDCIWLVTCFVQNKVVWYYLVQQQMTIQNQTFQMGDKTDDNLITNIHREIRTRTDITKSRSTKTPIECEWRSDSKRYFGLMYMTGYVVINGKCDDCSYRILVTSAPHLFKPSDHV
jgi:hypothetical protein